jgi:hypothetical protein
VYLDEFFPLKEIIDKRKKEEYVKEAQLHLIPNMDDKQRTQFFKELTSEFDPVLNHEVKTDFSAIDRAREQLKRN